MEDMTGYRLEEGKHAIDGCSIPAYAFPLRAVALGFAKAAAHSLEALARQVALEAKKREYRVPMFDLDLRVDQPGRPDHLLGEDAAGLLHLPRAGRRRDEDGLGPHRVPFLELQRPVVQRRGQAEAIQHQVFLARAVALVHRAQLRNHHVALVQHQQKIVWKVVNESHWRRFWRSSV